MWLWQNSKSASILYDLIYTSDDVSKASRDGKAPPIQVIYPNAHKAFCFHFCCVNCQDLERVDGISVPS